MAFSDTKQLRSAFFHFLSKTQTEFTQNPYESIYKSGHSIYSNEVFAEEVPFAINETAANNNVTNYPNIIKKYSLASLTPVPGSNNQAWFLNDGGAYIRPFLTPVDVMNTAGEPSYGYELQLFRENDTRIFPTQGNWNVDAYSGLILFEPGFTPVDLGWGNIKITCYVYTGMDLNDALAGVLGGTVYQDPVLSKDVKNPSTLTPSDGNRYIVGSNSYAITQIDIPLKRFYIFGDVVSDFVSGTKIKVKESFDLLNDGYYTLTSVNYNAGVNSTLLTVSENIVSGLAVGTINYSYDVWNNNVDDIATYNSGVWNYREANQGFISFVEDISTLYNFNGNYWVNIGSGAIASTTNTDTLNFNYILDATDTDVQTALDKLDKIIFDLFKPTFIHVNTTISNEGKYFIDTSGGDVTITLSEISNILNSSKPIIIKNSVGSNKVIIQCTQNIEGSTDDYILEEKESVSLIGYFDNVGFLGEYLVYNREYYGRKETLTIINGQYIYSLLQTPYNNSVNVYVNGVKLNDIEYTVTLDVIEFFPLSMGFDIDENDTVIVEYF